MYIALSVEYRGNQYHGWQCQPGLHTVQQEVEQALSRIATHDVKLTCAGRTDTGVHATNQVVHFETDAVRDDHAWLYGTNSYSPKDIKIRWVRTVSEDFHARFSALSRRYVYVIYNRRVSPAVLNGLVTWHARPLDDTAMAEAAKHFSGEQDFSSFRSSACQSKSPTRTIQKITINRYHELIVLDITANAFLHHMVRNIVGALISVGEGKRSPDWVAEVLAAKDRRHGAETAPPYGLYLIDVGYPKHFALPEGPEFPLFIPQCHVQNTY